jgi:hypothetical protein
VNSWPGHIVKRSGLFAACALVALLLAVACSSEPGGQAVAAPSTNTPFSAPQVTPAPTDIWTALHMRTPYPFTTPLPPSQRTVLDGTYVKTEPYKGEHVHCLRCPDYLAEGGTWLLSLDRGVFRIYHEATGWDSLGSFTVVGDRLWLFNDPVCTYDIGVYTWKLEGDALVFHLVGDECAIKQRALNFTNLPWQSCQPPSIEAGVTDHWPKPAGCR